MNASAVSWNSIAARKRVACGLRTQPLALFVLKVGDGVRLGLPQVVFQCVVLGRLSEKLCCDGAQVLNK